MWYMKTVLLSRYVGMYFVPLRRACVKRGEAFNGITNKYGISRVKGTNRRKPLWSRERPYGLLKEVPIVSKSYSRIFSLHTYDNFF